MNTFGERIKVTIFGESHGPALGMVLDGIRAGITLDMAAIASDLARRAPSGATIHTARKETDLPEFLSGLLNGVTTGAPICAIIRNQNIRPQDYEKNHLRPSHADFAAHCKFSGLHDYRGGGHFSGRLTAAFVLAGAICKQALEMQGIAIEAQVVQVGEIKGDRLTADMEAEILRAKAAGDSVGSVVECVARSVPAGVGGLLFGGMESRIAAMLYAVPGVKGVEFGAGFSLASMRGSESNDPFRLTDGKIVTSTNHAGGINGGITNGMTVVVRAAFRPTSSISLLQRTVDLATMQETELTIQGRHDPCLAPRALPVVEACVAFCLLDAMKEN